MARYAMVQKVTGFVVNVIEWDGNEATWKAPDAYEMIEDTEAVAGPGFTYEDGQFVPPPAPPGPEEPA